MHNISSLMTLKTISLSAMQSTKCNHNSKDIFGFGVSVYLLAFEIQNAEYRQRSHDERVA